MHETKNTKYPFSQPADVEMSIFHASLMQSRWIIKHFQHHIPIIFVAFATEKCTECTIPNIHFLNCGCGNE